MNPEIDEYVYEVIDRHAKELQGKSCPEQIDRLRVIVRDRFDNDDHANWLKKAASSELKIARMCQDILGEWEKRKEKALTQIDQNKEDLCKEIELEAAIQEGTTPAVIVKS